MIYTVELQLHFTSLSEHKLIYESRKNTLFYIFG